MTKSYDYYWHNKTCDEPRLSKHVFAGHLCAHYCPKCKKVKIGEKWYEIKEIVLLAEKMKGFVEDAESLIDLSDEEYRVYANERYNEEMDLQWVNSYELACQSDANDGLKGDRTVEKYAEDIYKELSGPPMSRPVGDETKRRVAVDMPEYQRTLKASKVKLEAHYAILDEMRIKKLQDGITETP